MQDLIICRGMRQEKNQPALSLGIPDAQLFKVGMVDDHYEKIIQFLEIGKALDDFITSQKKQLVVQATDFQLIVGQLYKMGLDEILH